VGAGGLQGQPAAPDADELARVTRAAAPERSRRIRIVPGGRSRGLTPRPDPSAMESQAEQGDLHWEIRCAGRLLTRAVPPTGRHTHVRSPLTRRPPPLPSVTARRGPGGSPRAAHLSPEQVGSPPGGTANRRLVEREGGL